MAEKLAEIKKKGGSTSIPDSIYFYTTNTGVTIPTDIAKSYKYINFVRLASLNMYFINNRAANGGISITSGKHPISDYATYLDANDELIFANGANDIILSQT